MTKLDDGFVLRFALVPVLALAAGAGAFALGRADFAGWIWAAGAALVLIKLLLSIVTSLRRGEIGLDIVAALAMAGALAGGEFLAGVIVATMYAGGEALEAYAQGSARREMTALLSRVPRTAQVRRGERLETTPIESISPGDRLLIRAGEGVPVDGFVRGAAANLDESALTGESMTVRRGDGDAVSSGVANAGPTFELEAARTAAQSTYAGIVRLVEAARASKSPMSRLADLYSLGFLAVTVALAGGAAFWTQDWRRALAVLVVATPCPLILAVPVAIVSGMSAMARRGVLMKSARALEALAKVTVLLIDKTGTLTLGRARVDGGAPDELLAVAASLAQGSQHALSTALVDAAHERGLALHLPSEVEESAGEGLAGIVAGARVVIGHPDFVRRRMGAGGSEDEKATGDGSRIAVGVDGRLAGAIDLADPLRADALATLRAFKANGIMRIVLVTGDRPEVAQAIAAALPIDRVIANASPADKVEAVRAEARNGRTLMVGDGINDAPALALADVGVALGARGAAAASEAADAVVLVDRLDNIAMALRIARRTRAIALESVGVGLGLSFVGMIAAAAGYLPPIAGALAQEAIDVAVVLNALRSLRTPT